MNYKLSLAVALLPMLVACGGGGGGDDAAPIDDTDRGSGNPTITTEDRTRPAPGLLSSDGSSIKDNGANPFPNEGPQEVTTARVASWPGLRYGDFLLLNNPWNASAAAYDDWYQTISLNTLDNGVQAIIDWDWGAANDHSLGTAFATKSYPEVVYGTKSAAERSGNFAETGLPVEHFDMPEITIDYDYWYQGRRSASPNLGGNDSEFNIAIESFYHDSCDIRRTGSADDNHIMEVMVWLKVDERLPSGNAPHPTPFTSSDGRVYDVYAKSSNFNYIAYVAREDQNSGTVLYSEILNDAKDKAGTYGVYQIKDTDCLANILFGPEIWYGAGTFTLSGYQINRTY